MLLSSWEGGSDGVFHEACVPVFGVEQVLAGRTLHLLGVGRAST